MNLKNQKGSITLFVLIALLFYMGFLLLMYANNSNKIQTISEKVEAIKAIYAKNFNNIDEVYNRRLAKNDTMQPIIKNIPTTIIKGETEIIEPYVEYGSLGGTTEYKAFDRTFETISDIVNYIEQNNLYGKQTISITAIGNNDLVTKKEIEIDFIELEYTKLEYIESTGTQFLNLGSLPVKNDFPYINCTFQYVKRQTHQKDTILSQENYVANSWMISQQYQQKRLYWWANSWGKSLYVDREDYLQSVQTFINENKDVTLMINNDILSFKNITSTPYNYTPIFLLYGHGSTNTIARIFKLHIGNSKEDIVMNLIPVIRKSDNEVCMYDTVSGQFFENQGTGEFIAGPVLRSSTSE